MSFYPIVPVLVMDRQLLAWKTCFLVSDEAFSALQCILAGDRSYQAPLAHLGGAAVHGLTCPPASLSVQEPFDHLFSAAGEKAGPGYDVQRLLPVDFITDIIPDPHNAYDVHLPDLSSSPSDTSYLQYPHQSGHAGALEQVGCQSFDTQVLPLDNSMCNPAASECDTSSLSNDFERYDANLQLVARRQDRITSRAPRKRDTNSKPCARCWMDKRKCHKKYEACANCLIGNIPSQLCFPARFASAAVFRRWKNSHYSSKLTWGHLFWTHATQPVKVQHYRGGPTIKFEVSGFQASTQDETNVYWKDAAGWQAIATTAFGLQNPMQDLSAYVAQHTQFLLTNTTESPIQQVLASANPKDELVRLAAELWTASRLLMRGWGMAGQDTLGIPMVEDVRCPLNGTVPAPRVLQNQLDHNLEYYIIAKEEQLLKKMQNSFLKRGVGSTWEGMCAAVVVLLRVLERDTWRLAYWRNRHDQSYKWRHQSAPETLIGANLHLAHLLLAHFRVAGSLPQPLGSILETTVNRSVPQYRVADESSLDDHLISLLLTPTILPSAEW